MKFTPKGRHFFCRMALLMVLACWSSLQTLPVRAGNDDQCGSMCNRDNKKSLEVGDPIMAAIGALRFALPLLGLGGPMNVHFTVMYGSDYVNWRKNDLGFGNAGNGRFWWSPGCAAYLDSGLYQFWLDDFRQVAFNPSTKEIVEFNEPQSVRYQLEDSDSYVYLMDPIRELVYIFSKDTALIKALVDRNGNELAYAYDGNNRLQTVGDGLGRALNFTYTDIGGTFVITQVADQQGRTVNLNYDAQGADNNNRGTLRSISDPVNQTTTFSYTATNFITSVQYPEGNIPYTQEWAEKAIYNDSFATRVVKQTTAYNHVTEIGYDNTTDQVIEATPDGNQTIYEHFDHHAPPKGLTDAASKSMEFTRNDRNQITGLTDRTGGQTLIAYHDQTGKIASVSNAKNQVLTYTYTAQEQTVTNPINNEQVSFTFYNLTKIDYPDGTSETFVYDNNQIDPNLVKGNMTAHTDRTGKTWNYTYNDRGQVLTGTNPEGGMVTYTYNADATLASSTDSDTGVTTYTYDVYKRLTRITRPGGAFVQIVYDLNDRITSVTDERGKKYDYAYDTNGNVASIADPDTKQTLFSHDLLDRVNEITNARGKKSQYAYDNMNRLRSVTDPNANNVQYGYNSRGWLEKVTDGEGYEWTTGFDNEGLPTSKTTPLGRTTTITRDALGYISNVKNPLNQETVLTRDELSRITKVRDPLNRETFYAYNDAGDLAGVTLPVVGATQYRRNGLGLLDRITDLKGSQWNLGYTNMGRLSTLNDPRGNQWQYSYDTQGRLNQITYPGGSTQTRTFDDAGNLLRSQYATGPDLNYTYDNQNRLLTAENVAFTYSDTGQVTATTNPGATFGATYDDGGRFETATYANDLFAVTYTYEARDLLTQVTDSMTNTTIDFSYDNDGRLMGMTRSNSANTTFEWDNASRMTRIQHGALANLQYTYNAAGEVTKLDYDLPLDPADHLASTTESFAYDTASQITTTGYSYDTQGRQTAAPGQNFTWNGANRLTATSTATLTYNGLNDLLTRQTGGSTTHYYYNYALDLHPIVAEYNETTSSWKRFYILTPGGKLLYLIDAANGNEVAFYHYDHIGNTLFLTNAAGAITDKYAYSPYGKLLAHEGTSDQPFTFVGAWQVRQENSDGLFQMRARYYDARTARFLSRELAWPAIRQSRSLNTYQYAWNNPAQYVDTTGLWKEEALDVGEGIATIFGFDDVYGLIRDGFDSRNRTEGVPMGNWTDNIYNTENFRQAYRVWAALGSSESDEMNARLEKKLAEHHAEKKRKKQEEELRKQKERIDREKEDQAAWERGMAQQAQAALPVWLQLEMNQSKIVQVEHKVQLPGLARHVGQGEAIEKALPIAVPSARIQGEAKSQWGGKREIPVWEQQNMSKEEFGQLATTVPSHFINW